MKGFDGQPHAIKCNWETFHFTFTRLVSSFRLHPQSLKTQFTTKKTAKTHYNRNIHISKKGNPVKHWHLQHH